MKRTIVAAVFALLIAASPAQAATITLEDINLNFGNGYTASGSITLLYIPVYFGGTPYVPCLDCQNQPPNLTLNFDGSPLTPYDGRYGDLRGLGNTSGWPVLFLAPFPYGVDALSGSTGPNVPMNFADFTLNGTPAISGDVECVSGACAVTPLPDALPMFSAAMMALGGFAWRSRRQQRG